MREYRSDPRRHNGEDDWQGFDVADGLIYWLEGEGSTSGSIAYLTVFNCYGDIVEDRTGVSAASDADAHGFRLLQALCLMSVSTLSTSS